MGNRRGNMLDDMEYIGNIKNEIKSARMNKKSYGRFLRERQQYNKFFNPRSFESRTTIKHLRAVAPRMGCLYYYKIIKSD